MGAKPQQCQVVSIGVMTGTSVDAADFSAHLYSIAHPQALPDLKKILGQDMVPFPKKLQKTIHEAQKGLLSLAEFVVLQRDYSEFIAKSLSDFLAKKLNGLIPPKSLIVAGIHGQTLWHVPPKGRHRGASLQMLDPVLVAELCKISVVSQFRQGDLAQFGQGAPLLPSYLTYLQKKESQENSNPKKLRVFQNIGGISNLSYELNRKIFAFDNGPGNALIDLAVRQWTHHRWSHDPQGQWAAQGSIQQSYITKALKHSYLLKRPPKSTGKELFNEAFLKRYFPLSGKDLIASVTMYTAQTLVQSYELFLPAKKELLISVYGGGAKNKTLISFLKEALESKGHHQLEIMEHSDFLEADAFAYFAVLGFNGHSIASTSATGAKKTSHVVGVYQY